MLKSSQWQGVPVIVMENDQLEVSLAPSINNNVYRIYDKTLRRDVLLVPDSPQQLQERPVYSGTPILMPPNRIRHGKFSFDGRAYQLDCNWPDGNHIHGILGSLPWNVVEQHSRDGVDTVISQFHIADHPEALRQYPHELTLEVEYRLKGSSLVHTLRAINNSSKTAPFGYGLHTWFLLDHQPQQWTMTLPADGIWELDSENIPTDRILPLDGRLAGLADGVNLQHLDLDTVFRIGANAPLAALRRQNCEIRYSGSELIKHWVIYTQGEAENVICLEPYTWVTNAPNSKLPPAETGLIAIAPGEKVELDITLDIVYD